MSEDFLKDMSDDEVQYLLSKLQPEPEPKAEPVPNVTVNVNSDEIADKIAARQPQKQSEVPARAKFDNEQYWKIAQNDPQKAAEYLEEATYGMAITKNIPLVFGAMQQITQELQTVKEELARTRLGVSNEDATKLNTIMKQYNLSRDSNGYEAAREIAKSRGIIDEPQQTSSKPVPPPRTKSRGQEAGTLTEEQIRRQIDAMSDKEMEDYLISTGQLRRRYLS